ncbi:Altered inheritance of mitochondria protein 34, mitochondrial, partial [Clarias magur]
CVRLIRSLGVLTEILLFRLICSSQLNPASVRNLNSDVCLESRRTQDSREPDRWSLTLHSGQSRTRSLVSDSSFRTVENQIAGPPTGGSPSLCGTQKHLHHPASQLYSAE